MSTPHLYLAGPMTGLPDHNFPAFERAATRLRAVGYRVTSPHETPAADGSTHGSLTWAEYVRADLLAMLTQATAVATLPGWQHSAGARLEAHIAGALGWSVRTVDEWAASAQQQAPP